MRIKNLNLWFYLLSVIRITEPFNVDIVLSDKKIYMGFYAVFTVER